METQANQRALSDELVGDSPGMRQLRRQAFKLAGCDVSLLLEGETGTGKEVVARTVHRLSRRADRPFIGVNCAAIHESLLESELFGHTAGAFTGATHATLGFLRAAEGGTILLDEVGDMSGPLQSKLLRVFEERSVVPVGGTEGIPIDVRVIAATHRNLAEAVREGTFRQDLYYRLNVVCLSIPPLRERRGDVRVLAEHLAGRMATALGLPVKPVSEEAMSLLVRYDWPGNIRELANVLQRAHVLGSGPAIEVQDLPPALIGGWDQSLPEFPTLREAVGRHVQDALEQSGGLRGQAAQMLAIDRKTLRRMISRHHLA